MLKGKRTDGFNAIIICKMIWTNDHVNPGVSKFKTQFLDCSFAMIKM